MMPSIFWTEFASYAADVKREHAQEWADLVEHLRSAEIYESKAVCPWIKLARFGHTRTRSGSLRHNSNVVEITGVEGDYDGGAVKPEHAVVLLERAGIRACVYTSPSHTPHAPRWRVLAPLSQPAPSEHRSRLLARINGVLGGILSSESFTLSQSYYYGRVREQKDYRVLVTFDDPDEGEPIDLLDDLDQVAVVSRALPAEKQNVQPSHCIAVAVEHLGRRLRTGDSRRELLRTYIADKSRRGLDVDEIMHLVGLMAERFFDPADPLDTANIRRIAIDFVQADYASGSSASVNFGSGQPETAPRLMVNLDALAAMAKSITWCVKGIMPADSLGVMFGGSGTFKSFIALDMALHIAHGLPWMGRKTKRAPVVYIAAEGGAGLWRRIEAWHKARKLSHATIEFYVVPVSLDLCADADKVVAEARAVNVEPGLVVVDTMSQTFSGEENSANEVAAYLRTLGTQFRAMWSAAVLVIHHSGHQATERPRGSSAIRANVDFMFGVFREEKEMIARVECHKQKDGDMFSEVSFALDQVSLGFDEDGDPVYSLHAKYIESEEELQQRKQAEAMRGRGGRDQVALSLAQEGMDVEAWRQAFYATLPDDMKADARKHAFSRVRDSLAKAGAVETAYDKIGKRYVITYVSGQK
jgi:hypothetical protein